MTKISGIETILIPTVAAPMRVEVSHNTVYKGQLLLEKWILLGMCFIPYCCECKEQLYWIIPPEGDLLFVCGKCKREWIKDNEWILKDEAVRTNG